MRIYLHNNGGTTTNTLASFNDTGAPRWLRGAYHPMGNGYELRVELVRPGKAMIVTRPVGFKKQASTLTVPVVGGIMPMTLDIEIDETGKPTWNMKDVVNNLLGEFGLLHNDIRVLPEGKRLEMSLWHERTLIFNSEATHHAKIPSLAGEGLPVEAVDGAFWVIVEAPGGMEIVVWTHLSGQPTQLEQLRATLRELTRKAA